jgi:hypothetical protein
LKLLINRRFSFSSTFELTRVVPGTWYFKTLKFYFVPGGGLGGT